MEEVCFECTEGTLIREKVICFFCNGTGKNEDLDGVSHCGMCDEDNKLNLISCTNKECLLNGDDDEEELEENKNEQIS